MLNLILIFFLISMTKTVSGHNSWWSLYDTSHLAVVCVPVADTILEPASKIVPNHSMHELYRLPLLCKNQDELVPCLRAHQCLFNEIVTDVETCGLESAIKIPHAEYNFDELGKPINRFYTLTSNIVTFDELKKNNISWDDIPTPSWAPLTKDHAAIVLIWPWNDPVTGRRYSAGTRFARIPAGDTAIDYAINIIDYQNKKNITTRIAKSLCIQDKKRTPQKTRVLFLKIINNWLEQTKGIIPYVWGGSSFVHAYNDKPIKLIAKTICKKQALCWTRHEEIGQHTGFDCSGLIWRVAHMLRIPFACKNSRMISLMLEEVNQQNIEPGDIIWVPGHVMIVSDISHNEIIEAAGYPDGFGKLHKIKLYERLEGISTLDQLLDAYRNKKKLMRLTRDKKIAHVDDFKIFKLIGQKQQQSSDNREKNL